MRIELGTVGVEASHGSALIRFGSLGQAYVGICPPPSWFDVWRSHGSLCARLGRMEVIWNGPAAQREQARMRERLAPEW